MPVGFHGALEAARRGDRPTRYASIADLVIDRPVPMRRSGCALPAPSDHGLRDEATIVVPVPAEGLVLFRLLEREVATLRDFEERRTRGQAERDGLPELFRLSVSHWLSQDGAATWSRRRRFFIARLELRPGTLTRVALTEDHGAGHVDVWAHPQELLDAVADVVSGVRQR